MTMTEQDIINKVRVILNEAGEESSLSLLSEDTVKLSDYIKGCIGDAVTLVQQRVSPMSVNSKMVNAPAQVSNGVGSISLPSDYVRLISVKMGKWNRPCFTAMSAESEEFKQQCNPYTRTGVNKPMCFYAIDGDGRKLLFYPGLSGDELSYLIYEAGYSSSEGLSLDEHSPLALAVCYMTASLVYLIFENKPSSDNMAQMAAQYIQKALA